MFVFCNTHTHYAAPCLALQCAILTAARGGVCRNTQVVSITATSLYPCFYQLSAAWAWAECGDWDRDRDRDKDRDRETEREAGAGIGTGMGAETGAEARAGAGAGAGTGMETKIGSRRR